MAHPDSPPASSPLLSTRALREFLATEVAGGAVLLVATVVALGWANSPWEASYDQLWHTELGVEVGRWRLALDLREWVNEGLMAIFFLVVGLEIKREVVQGELRDRRQAVLPIIAAAGGMVVPAALYALFNAGGPGGDGWGIPIATDIAFALGVLALVAPRLPGSLRLFLLTLAIVDDIGAILVIAVFYADDVAPAWLVGAAALVAVAWGLRRLGVTATPLYVAIGVGIWLALHEAGVHATLAGVAMGLLAPAAAVLDRHIVHSRSDELLDVFTPSAARTTTRIARQSVSELEWLEHTLHPWSSLVIVPVFALANAGVVLSGDALDAALTSPVTVGVVVGLVIGKTLGITAASWIAVRTGLANLPADTTLRQLTGVAALGGIGFTVSLFVAGLAFTDAALGAQAKIGIVAASLLASVLGAILLRAPSRPPAEQPETRDPTR